MYTDEEMDKQNVKSDTDGETGETKQDKDRTHTDEENSENWRLIAGRGQHSLSIYILLNKVHQKMDDKTISQVHCGQISEFVHFFGRLGKLYILENFME